MGIEHLIFPRVCRFYLIFRSWACSINIVRLFSDEFYIRVCLDEFFNDLLPKANFASSPQHCWELLRPFSPGKMFDWFQTFRVNSPPLPPPPKKKKTRTQHVTSNNVGSCWLTMFRPFTRGFKFVIRFGFVHQYPKTNFAFGLVINSLMNRFKTRKQKRYDPWGSS